MNKPDSKSRTTKQKIETHKNKRALLSANTNDAIRDLIALVDNLQTIYTTETEALEAGDAQAFMLLQGEKFAAAQQYQSGIVELISRKEEMQHADPALKQELKNMQNEFATIAQRNMKALKRMQKTANRLGNTILKAVKDAVSRIQSVGYGQSGHLDNNKKRILPTTISETA